MHNPSHLLLPLKAPLHPPKPHQRGLADTSDYGGASDNLPSKELPWAAGIALYPLRDTFLLFAQQILADEQI